MAPTNMRHSLIILVTAYFLAGCTSPKKETTVVANDTTENVITLSKAQYEAASISVGKIEKKKIITSLRVNGRLEVPPQNLITISAPMNGFVKSTKLLQGMKVRKGEILATLQHQDYIQLQQDYLDNKSKLEFLKADYNRQQELAQENINAQKTFQQAKSQYESMVAIVAGLEAKLELINISPASLNSGKISSVINLYSPLDGYVSMVNVNIGQYVTSTEAIFKIVNMEHMHAELQVYEQDINKISVGQSVTFVLANESTPRNATVYLIGKEISAERTVQLHCHLAKEDHTLLPGTFISARIDVNTEESDVLPSEAIVNFEGKNYIFIAIGNNQFKATPVTIGDNNNDFTRILLDPDFNRESSIVLTGAFELIGLLKNKEEE